LDNWLNQDNYLIISYPKANRANLLALGFQACIKIVPWTLHQET